MADEHKVSDGDRKPGSQKNDRLEHPLEGLSDSRLTAIQRVVREHYKIPPDHEKAPTKLFNRSSEGDSASSLSSIRHFDSVDALHRLLADLSPGINETHLANHRIQRSFSSDSNRYMLGPELAIVAIVAVAGIAKRRADLSSAGIAAVGENDISSTKDMKGKKKESEDLKTEFLYRSPLLEKRIKDKVKPGLTGEIPEWMISLDGSSAAESGYLFGSVLRRHTILMTQSDTFNSLAEAHFHDRVLGWLIVDLNMRKVKEIWKDDKRVIAVSNGETIELPVWEDIVEFYQNKPKNVEPDNLITIVMKRKLDRELIEAALAKVLAPEEASIVAKDDDGK